jgi:hypothetical protein
MVGGSIRVLPPASSTTKTGRHDIAEILLKVALKHQKLNQINQINSFPSMTRMICIMAILEMGRRIGDHCEDCHGLKNSYNYINKND